MIDILFLYFCIVIASIVSFIAFCEVTYRMAQNRTRKDDLAPESECDRRVVTIVQINNTEFEI